MRITRNVLQRVSVFSHRFQSRVCRILFPHPLYNLPRRILGQLRRQRRQLPLNPIE